jgi:hypothetical protein
MGEQNRTSQPSVLKISARDKVLILAAERARYKKKEIVLMRIKRN